MRFSVGAKASWLGVGRFDLVWIRGASGGARGGRNGGMLETSRALAECVCLTIGKGVFGIAYNIYNALVKNSKLASLILHLPRHHTIHRRFKTHNSSPNPLAAPVPWVSSLAPVASSPRS